MRRALRSDLPTLAFLYGIHWADVAVMPFGELNAHLEQAQKFIQIVARGGG